MLGLHIGPQLMDSLSAGHSPPEGKVKGKVRPHRHLI